MRDDVRDMILSVFKLAIDEQVSPRMDLLAQPDSIERYMYSNEHMPKMREGEPEVWGSKEDNPQMCIRDRVRSGRRGCCDP